MNNRANGIRWVFTCNLLVLILAINTSCQCLLAYPVGSTDKFISIGIHTSLKCLDCHSNCQSWDKGAYAFSIDKVDIPKTCSKCHKNEYLDYQISIHGIGLSKGVADTPVCTDCHGSHLIQPLSSSASSTIIETCCKCHDNPRIQKAYNLPGDRMSTYLASFHGTVNKYGDANAANCTSCHGSHKILPAKDPQSTVNPRNLPYTCGKCHQGAGASFAKGDIHINKGLKSSGPIRWVSSIYTCAVISLTGSFFCFVSLDLFSRIRRRYRSGGRR